MDPCKMDKFGDCSLKFHVRFCPLFYVWTLLQPPWFRSRIPTISHHLHGAPVVIAFHGSTQRMRAALRRTSCQPSRIAFARTASQFGWIKSNNNNTADWYPCGRQTDR